MNEQPENWVNATLEDLCVSITTGRRPKGGARGIETGVLSLGGEHISSNGTVDTTTPRFIPPSFAEGIPSAKICPLDVLIVKDGATTGKVAIADERFEHERAFVNEHVFRCRAATHMNSRYMFSFLKSEAGKAAILSDFRGAAQGGISREFSRKTLVPVPPFSEQLRIVARVESLSAKSGRARSHLEHLPRLVEKYKQALLAAAFRGDLTHGLRASEASSGAGRSQVKMPPEGSFASTDRKHPNPIVRKARKIDEPTPDQLSKIWEIPASWRWVQVGQCAFVTKLAGFEYTKFVSYHPDGDLNVLKAENAGPDGFRSTSYSKVRSSEVSQLGRSHLRGGELIVVFVGAGTGNVGIVPQDKQFFLGPNIGMVRPNSDHASSRYMELFFRSSLGKQLLLATSKAVAQPSLSMGAIRSTPIALPSLQEQAEIVRHVDAAFAWVDRLASNAASARGLINYLDQAVLAKAFRGELVPQDPSDEPASMLLERIKAERATVER